MTSYPAARPDLIALLRRYEHELRAASPIHIPAIERKRAGVVAALQRTHSGRMLVGQCLAPFNRRVAALQTSHSRKTPQ